MTTTIEKPESATRIEGSVDPSTGNLDVSGDLHVAGNIADLHTVKCAGNAHIAGVIEAADVTVGGDLFATGGISGKGKGRCHISGNASARYISNATIEIEHDLLVQTEICASTIVCGGSLHMEAGTIIGGSATILRSVQCQSLGAPAATPTIVEIGIDEYLRRLARTSIPRIEQLRKKSTEIRLQAAPLLKMQKTLSSKQKEQVTEMLFEADAMESEALELQLALEKRNHAPNPDPSIMITNIVYPGVVVRFPEVQAQITTAIRGPIRLVARSAGGQKYIAAIEGADASGYPLPSKPYYDAQLHAVARLLSASA